MSEIKGSNVRLFIGDEEVTGFTAGTVQIKRPSIPLKVDLKYLGNSVGQYVNIWMLMSLSGFYPILQVHWTKPTNKQLRKFKRYVRKQLEH